MASRRQGRTPADQPPDARARLRRWVVIALGAYYVVTGLWAIIHFPSFARAVGLTINPFQAQAFAALILVVGANLLDAARRGAPGHFPTLLGATVAASIALVELIWLPRLEPAGALWLDLVVELAFAILLVVLYPRAQKPENQSSGRRR